MKKERRSKQERIAQLLRERIVRGEFAPGGLLPSRVQLLTELGVSTITLQGAFDLLAEDGFIAAKGSQGTFVAERPPHLSQYALIFHSRPQDAAWGRFAQVMLTEAAAIERAGAMKLPCYFGIEHSDSEDYQTLLRDIRQHRLAGLIFTDSAPVEHLLNTPLIDEPGIPRVAIMTGPNILNMPRVELDVARFYDRAVEHLLGRGRRNIAVLIKSGRLSEEYVRDDLDRVMSLPGVVHQPYWRQFVDVFDHASVRNAVHMLFHPNQNPRPDALIVTDDTMLDAATFGLIAAGARVPQDADVVSHFNFPVQAVSQVPVTRLGFDTRLILDVCLDTINRQCNGESLDGVVRHVPVTFEHELKLNTSPLVAALKSKAAAAV